MKPRPLNKITTFLEYKFKLYSLEGFNFDETIELEDLSKSDRGLYYFCKRNLKKNGKYKHTRLYLGKSENLDDRPLHKSHEKWTRLKKDGCNCLGIYICKNGEDPKQIESDILAKYNFEENIQENS